MNYRRFAVLVNLNARQGIAEKTWLQIREKILHILPSDTIEFTYFSPFDLEVIVNEMVVSQGVNCLISAGGDGSVNHLLNTILNMKNLTPGQVSIGGIGLGSSNDFFKPYGKMLQGVPVRMNPEKAILSDVGKVSFSDKEETLQHRYFIANASLGFTANANYHFNHPGPFLKILKKHWTGGAIGWTALYTLLFYQNNPATIFIDGKEHRVKLSNLAVLKNPNVSGNFKYDLELKPDDNQMGLCYCENMTRFELLNALFDLSKGRFSGKRKRHSRLIKQLKIQMKNPLPLETDGEVTMASNILFELMPSAINLLGTGFPVVTASESSHVFRAVFEHTK